MSKEEGASAASAWIRDLAALTPADARAVGNKALRQGLLLAAGFPVSAGFCVTAAAVAAWRAGGPAREDVRAALLAAYRELGGRVEQQKAWPQLRHGDRVATEQQTDPDVSGMAAVAAEHGTYG